MERHMVELKRTNQGVEIILDSAQVYDDLRDEIMKTLAHNERLIQGGGKAIFTGKTLNPAQKRELKSILFDDYGIFMVDFDEKDAARVMNQQREPEKQIQAAPSEARLSTRPVRELQAPEQNQSRKDFVDTPGNKGMETEEEPYLDKYRALHLRGTKAPGQKKTEPAAENGFNDFETAAEPYMDQAAKAKPAQGERTTKQAPMQNKAQPVPAEKKPVKEKQKPRKAIDRPAIVSTYNRNQTAADEMIFSIDEGSSLFIHGALRNGQRIQYNGDVVVLGNIEEEAEIHAGGNIAVLGQAMGKLHAGSTGNKDAVVAAMVFRPSELTVGGNGANIPPSTPANKPLKAYWDGKTIIIEPIG